MQDNLENKLSMYGAVISLLDANTTKTSSMTAFAPALLNLKNLKTQIEAKEIEHKDASTGKTANKQQAETALIKEAVRISAALFALGNATSNNVLIETGDKNKSFFKNLRDTDLKPEATIIYKAALDNTADIEAYGVSAAEITAFSNLIAAYEPTLGARESSRGLQTAAGKEVVSLFKQADTVLNTQLDSMMEKFASSDTQFYNQYHSAREIIDLGGRGGGEDPTPPPGPNP
jgi:hypothetical protein